jgi:hypothetical protein
MGAEQFVGNSGRRPKPKNYPQFLTAAAQAFPFSDRMQSTVAQPFLDLSRIPGPISSCYYSLKI